MASVSSAQRDPSSGQPPASSRKASAALLFGLLAPVVCVGMFGLGYLLLSVEPIARLVGAGEIPPLSNATIVILVVWMLGVPALLPIGLGIAALLEIKRQPGLGGRKRAVAGIVLGVLSLGVNYFVSILCGLLVSGAGHGRRFRVLGGARTAPVVPGADWASGDRPRTEGLDQRTRGALAAAWLEDAQAEHASVAAFSRLSLELLAAGAPPRLLEQTHRAALDEVRHAQACFALASAYAGQDLAAGAFPEAVAPGRRAQPVDRDGWLGVLATDSLRDGCLGEGYAARAAAEALLGATDAAVREALGAIALEEARHAELGWEVLEWCLEQGAESVNRAVAGELETLALTVSESGWSSELSPGALKAHGRLDRETQRALRDQAVEAVRARAAAHPRLQAACQPPALSLASAA